MEGDAASPRESDLSSENGPSPRAVQDAGIDASRSAHIVLVGLPGAGKSTIGRRLARVLGLGFHDTDQLIEQRLGGSIVECFERAGEARFRDIEADVFVEALSRPDATVIATGGGTVLRPSNRASMADSNALGIYLHATPDELMTRLARDTKRPLLQVADPLARLHSLYAERDAHYRAVSTHVVGSVGKPIADLVSQIARLVGDPSRVAERPGPDR